MATTNLYTVLSGLNATDSKLWAKIKGLSGDLNTTASELTTLISTTSGNIESNYTTLVSTTSGVLDGKIQGVSGIVDAKETAINNTIEAVSGTLKQYTDDQIEDLSGTVSGALEQLTVGAATYQLSAITTAAGYASTYQLLETKNGVTTPLANSIINIPKDQFLKDAVYNKTTETIDLTFNVGSGEGVDQDPTTVSIPVSGLVHEFEGVSGVAIDFNANGTTSQIKGVVDPTSETFLTVGADGFKLAGVQDAIDAASNAADLRLDALEDILQGFSGVKAVSSAFEADRSRLGTAESDIDALQDILQGFSGVKTVSSEFEAVDGRLDALEAATTGGLSGVAANTNIIVGTGTAQQVESSSYSLGTGTFDGTPSATKVATEAGAAKYADDAVDAALSGLNNNKIVVGNGNDTNKVKDSGVTITAQGSESTVQMDATSDTEVPTSKAVDAYVNDGLGDLLDDIEELQAEII